MKKINYLLLLVALFWGFKATSQADLYLKNPKPTIQNITRFTKNSSGKLFAITPKEVLVTTDNGNNWSVYMEVEGALDITFKNGIGFIVGDDLVLKSEDDGDTWTSIDIGHADPDPFHSVNITDNGNFYINSKLSVYRMVPGGFEWAKIHEFQNSHRTVRTIFLNNDVAHIAGRHNRLWKSTDGGDSWTLTHGTTETTNDFTDIFFYNETIGFATGNDGIYRSVDSGNSWSRVEIFSDCSSVSLTSENTGYATCRQSVVKTTDQGNTWNEVNILNIHTGYDYLKTIFFLDSNTGFVGGDFGVLFSTNNAGTDWNNYSITNHPILDIDVVNENISYAVIGTDIFKSSDGGNTWITINGPGVPFLRRVDFIADGIGFLAAGNKIFKTTDDGQNWEDTTSTNTVHSLHFIDQQTGLYSDLSSNNQRTYRTTDGGNTWNLVDNLVFEKIVFPTSTIGYAVAKPVPGDPFQSKNIYKTLDGGETWTENYDSSFSNNLNSLYFIDENFGYAAGANGFILKTLNGGISWQQLSNGSLGTPNIFDILYLDGKLYITSGSSYFTSTNETSWTLAHEFGNTGVTNISSYQDFYFIYGGAGIIYSNVDSNASLSNENINANNSLGNVFPNPAQHSFIIQLPADDHVKGFSLFNIAGKEVLRKDYQNINHKREVILNNLSEGIYILKIVNSKGNILTKKVIISQ